MNESLNEKKFRTLSQEEQNHISSDYRKTVHEGEIVFVDEKSAKAMTPQEIEQKLLRERDELLKTLGGGNGDSPRRGM